MMRHFLQGWPTTLEFSVPPHESFDELETPPPPPPEKQRGRTMDEETLEFFFKQCPKCDSEKDFRKQFCHPDDRIFDCQDSTGEHIHARCQECGYKAKMPCHSPDGVDFNT